MGKAIVVGVTLVVLVTIILAFSVKWSRDARKIGDLNRKQEAELRKLTMSAAAIFHGLGYTDDVQTMDILSERSTLKINNWLKEFETVQIRLRKEIDA